MIGAVEEGGEMMMVRRERERREARRTVRVEKGIMETVRQRHNRVSYVCGNIYFFPRSHLHLHLHSHLLQQSCLSSVNFNFELGRENNKLARPKSSWTGRVHAHQLEGNGSSGEGIAGGTISTDTGMRRHLFTIHNGM